MQVQNISNSQINTQTNFQGRVIIDGELSALPAKLVRKSAQTLKDIIADKPYDLFIRQNHREGRILITAQKEKDYIRGKGLKADALMDKNVDLYKECAEYVVKEQDLKLKYNPTFAQKCKRFFNKLGNRFMDIVQDKDEI